MLLNMNWRIRIQNKWGGIQWDPSINEWMNQSINDDHLDELLPLLFFLFLVHLHVLTVAPSCPSRILTPWPFVGIILWSSLSIPNRVRWCGSPIHFKWKIKLLLPRSWAVIADTHLVELFVETVGIVALQVIVILAVGWLLCVLIVFITGSGSWISALLRTTCSRVAVFTSLPLSILVLALIVVI